MSDWILGLTGGIGSGKSSAARCFAALGVDCVDADIAARQVVEPGTAALGAIAQQFGADILLADGQLDRAALRQRIFADPAQRNWLEELLHPLIRKQLKADLAAAKSPYAILVSPLLIESGQRLMCSRVLVIDLPKNLQIERSMQRDGNTRGQIEAILNAQLSRQERLSHADDVLVNDKDEAWLQSEVKRLHEFYLNLTFTQKNQ